MEWTLVSEINEMDYGLKEMNEWSEGIKMKSDKRANENEWLDVMCCKPITEHFCLSVSI